MDGLCAPVSPGENPAAPPGWLSRRSWFVSLAGLAAVATGWTPVTLAQQADTSMASKDEAEQAIPFDQLKPELRAKILAIVDRPTIYRRLPVQQTQCDGELHVFLVRYPEVVVNIWRLMGITTMEARRTAKYTIEGDDGAGTISRVDLVYGKPDTHLFLCEGSYEGPLFRRKLTGRSVLLLRSQYGRDRQGNPLVSDQLDMFLQVDNVGADLIARTMQSSVGKTIDVNFAESLKFLQRISDSAERNGPGMQNMATKLEECTPEVRTRFAELCADTHERAAERVAAAMGPVKVSPDGRIAQPSGIRR